MGLLLVWSGPSQPNGVLVGSPALGCDGGVRPLMFEEEASELPWRGCLCVKILLCVRHLKPGCLGSSPSSASYEPSDLTALNPSFIIWKVGIITAKTYIKFTVF